MLKNDSFPRLHRERRLLFVTAMTYRHSMTVLNVLFNTGVISPFEFSHATTFKPQLFRFRLSITSVFVLRYI
jgi:hypothetical protein